MVRSLAQDHDSSASNLMVVTDMLVESHTAGHVTVFGGEKRCFPYNTCEVAKDLFEAQTGMLTQRLVIQPDIDATEILSMFFAVVGQS